MPSGEHRTDWRDHGDALTDLHPDVTGPVFPDPFCPLGTCYIVNSRYVGLYMSEYAPMTFSGFESQIPVGQISSIGVLISASDLVCAKPSSGAQVTGITGQAWANTPNTAPAVV